VSDFIGYPDGWNNFAYVNNWVVGSLDPLGLITNEITSFFDALTWYAYGGGQPAKIGENVILQSQNTEGFNSRIGEVNDKLTVVPLNLNSGTIGHQERFFWNQGLILGGNWMNFWASTVNWTASAWSKEGDRYVRNISAKGNIFLYTTDEWDFIWNGEYSTLQNILTETAPELIANLYSLLTTGGAGSSYTLSGGAMIRDFTFSAKQYE